MNTNLKLKLRSGNRVGITHYRVANIPGAVPLISTFALTKATRRYAVALAGRGWKQVAREDTDIREGLNVVNGQITDKSVAAAFGMKYTPLENLFDTLSANATSGDRR